MALINRVVTHLDRIAAARRLPDLARALQAAGETYGFSSVVVVDVARRTGRARPSIVFVSRVKTEVERFAAEVPMAPFRLRRAEKSDRPFRIAPQRQRDDARGPWPLFLHQQRALGLPVHRADGLAWYARCSGKAPDRSALASATLHAAAHAAYDRLLRLVDGRSGHSVLSPRQAACVEAIAQGCSVAQIGEMLAMTPAAVRAQLDQARRRLGVAKRVRALAARSRGDGLA